MGKALVAACLLFAAAACQPMYEKKAETLRNPKSVRPPPPEPVAEVQYVDDCTVDFSGKVVKQRQTPAAAKLVVEGDTSLQAAAKSAPTTPTGATAIQHAIDRYSEALRKDPYNAEATLKLALAYDHVLRKGCALAMLRRLEGLASNQLFEKDAEPMVQQVVNNPHWFRAYHNDALKAVGH